MTASRLSDRPVEAKGFVWVNSMKYVCFGVIMISAAYVSICNSNVEKALNKTVLASSSSSSQNNVHRLGTAIGRYVNNETSIAVESSRKRQKSTRNDESSSEKIKTKSKNTKKKKKKSEIKLEKSTPKMKKVEKKKDKKKQKVKNIALLGERHSGTNWITSELRKCFPTLTVSTTLEKYKHWFQSNDSSSPSSSSSRPLTLVVAQFRNVYEWTEAMRHIPHHSPHHVYLDWKTFVTKPWGMPRPRRDLDLPNKTGAICNWGFQYNEIISCVRGKRTDEEYVAVKAAVKNRTMYSGHSPIYELRRDGSGEPYGSVLELRAAKIRNYLSVGDWDWVEGVIPVRYEALVKNGTDFFLSLVEEVVGVKRRCKAVPPQIRKTRKLKKDYVDWVTHHVDWEAESLVGYEKWGEEEEEEEEEEAQHLEKRDDEHAPDEGDDFQDTAVRA